MHDTAYRIGGLAMRLYCDLETAHILEIGAQNINGTLRDFALPGTRYTGLDIEAAADVDLVMVPGEPFPVEDDAFDLVMASSVFEHDPAFWLTFIEMCRKAKAGGYIYINAPSNGAFHQYPQDHWRFYPDCGLALVNWANSQGVEISLVESFVAERQGDMWNDYVGVFRKGMRGGEGPQKLLSDEVACTNLRTWRSDGMERRRDGTEDMQLIRQLQEKAQALEGEARQMLQQANDNAAELERTVQERDELHRAEAAARQDMQEAQARLASLESTLTQRQEEIARASAELKAQQDLGETQKAMLEEGAGRFEEAQDRLASLESTLTQRQEEIAQAYAELKAQQDLGEMLKAMLEESEGRFEESVRKRAESDGWVFRLAGERKGLETQVQRLERKLNATEREYRISVAEREWEREARDRKLHDKEMEAAAAREEKEAAERRLTEELAAERTRAKAELDQAHLRASAELQGLRNEKASAEGRLTEELAAERTRAKAELDQAHLRASAELQGLRNEKVTVETRLSERFGEIAAITRLLGEKESAARLSEEQAAWLREVSAVLLNGSGTLKGRLQSLLPAPIRYAKQKASLKRKGMFDPDAYLAANPDVAETGMDPLRHYIMHGIGEGRQRHLDAASGGN